MKILLFYGISIISVLLNAGSVWASGGETAQHGTPFSYVVAWLVLILVLTIVRRAYKKSRPVDEHGLESEEHTLEHAPVKHKGGKVPVFLMLAVAFLFLTESLSAMASYHEPFFLGSVRFLMKMGSGVLLLLYGLSFMHGHDEPE